MSESKELAKRISKGSVNVEALSHKTFLFAYHIIEKLYGGGKEVLYEITFCDEGMLIYDGVKPIGVCMVNHHPVGLEYPLVMNCCVYEEYKGTKFAFRLLKELKKMVKTPAYYIVYAGADSPYKGKIDSIETIVKTKSIGKNGIHTLIGNK